MGVWFEEAGSGAPVVLLHSSAADARMWDPLWVELAARFRVVRLDFRGFGRSPWAAQEPYTDAGDVADVLDGLGVREAAVVGASHGGRVALEVATARPDLVGRLVLLAAGMGLPPTPELRAFGQAEDAFIEADDVEGAVRLNVDTWLGPEAGEAERIWVAEMQRTAFELQLAADPEPTAGHLPIDLAAITAPAVVVSGVHDLPYFQDTARTIAAGLASAELVELAWAGHLPSIERPGEVTRLLLDRLGDLSGRLSG
ncbi:alpha/beta hydrolase [Herbidospora sp. NBRC 101105]|uniref:alpha/beta fold hydrolase n=1 Tax=Herbidospora sp. NBRC 101105 TaxID=3032195 RepID=UPI0024A5A507|nr:alpha/beta hydrolase [Herbidospora sp. NBRC 101105]GLX93807.1 alpha/beta hydrolase [Herbidospora sp. NBRC 101105]